MAGDERNHRLNNDPELEVMAAAWGLIKPDRERSVPSEITVKTDSQNVSRVSDADPTLQGKTFPDGKRLLGIDLGAKDSPLRASDSRPKTGNNHHRIDRITRQDMI